MDLVNCPDCCGVGKIEEKCSICNGGGRGDCLQCGGNGKEYYYNNNADNVSRPCRYCNGSGVEGHCLSCASKGYNLKRCDVCGGIGKMQPQKAFAIVEAREKERNQQEAEARQVQEGKDRIATLAALIAKEKWDAEAPIRADAERRQEANRLAAVAEQQKQSKIREQEQIKKQKRAEAERQTQQTLQALWTMLKIAVILFLLWQPFGGCVWVNRTFASPGSGWNTAK